MNTQMWLHILGLVLCGVGASFNHVPALAPFADAITGIGVTLSGYTGITSINSSNNDTTKG